MYILYMLLIIYYVMYIALHTAHYLCILLVSVVYYIPVLHTHLPGLGFTAEGAGFDR